jgi:hypothetical protein
MYLQYPHQKKGVAGMCLRRSKKVNDVSVIDFRQIQRQPLKSPSLFKYCLPIIQYSVKRFFQSFQKVGRSTQVDPLSAVQNRATQRMILAAGLVVFFIALIRAYVHV